MPDCLGPFLTAKTLSLGVLPTILLTRLSTTDLAAAIRVRGVTESLAGWV